MAGRLQQWEKNTWTATIEKARNEIVKLTIKGVKQKPRKHDELVGDVYTTQKRKARGYANKRSDQATLTANRIHGAPFPKRRKARANMTTTIPKATLGTQWIRPSTRKISRLRTAIMRGSWDNQSQPKCAEMILACVFDPTRIDPLFAILMRTFTHAILRSDENKAHNFQQVLIQMFKKRSCNTIV